ncbi:MAG: Ppx/GppA phosphatase family protein, partial [Pyrinomonadaceae bacterium]
MKTEKLAAIDIGSNSIKLVIAEVAAADSFVFIYNDKDSVRFGSDTLRDKHLSEAAINRAAITINRFRQIAEARGAEKVLAVATASVREADNAAEFIAKIEAQTTVRVEVLSPVEEARVIGIAVASFFSNNAKTVFNIDIGGGSTELSLMKNGEPEQLFSMKIGAVGLTERFLKNDPPTIKELRELRTHIRSALDRPVREIGAPRWELATGTSGTILALSRLVNLDQSANGEISFLRLAEFNAELAAKNYDERLNLPTMSAQRADILIAGGQILEGVMRALKIKTLNPCDFALREGVIIDYLSEIEAESMPPVPDVADSRLKGVFAVGRRFGYEENHSLQVAALAEKIFDALVPIYNLRRHERTLLSAAALLHNIGYHIAHSEHHKHSLYLIKHSELTGFTESERNVIANVARYHRGSLPKEKHLDFMALNEAEKQTVQRLGAILRLANALDRSYCDNVRDVRLTRKNHDLFVEILSDEECSNELEIAATRADMFEDAFDCRVVFMRRPLS